MNDMEIDAMIHDLLNAIDYDIAKSYKEETAEEPESVEDSMNELRTVVRQHVSAREPVL